MPLTSTSSIKLRPAPGFTDLQRDDTTISWAPAIGNSECLSPEWRTDVRLSERDELFLPERRAEATP
eukprot:2274298-Prymnesium_polylepis.3